MIVRTVREQIRGVAERLGSVHQRLLFLDLETATPEEVNTIIGNNSWTDLRCNECGSSKLPLTVEVGESSRTASLCLPCLRKALSVAEEAEVCANFL